jgi:hypothetical protein
VAGRRATTSLRSALERYLNTRQGLGYKYHHQTRRLTDFVTFMEKRKATTITTKLAMEWATLPADRHATWALRLTRPEVEAILASSDRATWLGHLDFTLLLLAAQTGLRLSELISLDKDAVHLGAGPHVRCVGKGRKERCTALTAHFRVAIQAWLKEPSRRGASALFPGAGSVPTASSRSWPSMCVPPARDAKRVISSTVPAAASIFAGRSLAANRWRPLAVLFLEHHSSFAPLSKASQPTTSTTGNCPGSNSTTRAQFFETYCLDRSGTSARSKAPEQEASSPKPNGAAAGTMRISTIA